MERCAKSPSSAWFFEMGVVLLKGKTMENMDSKHPKMGIKMDDPSIIGILTMKNGMNTHQELGILSMKHVVLPSKIRGFSMMQLDLAALK